MFILDGNCLIISYKVANLFPYEQVSHRLSYLVGGIIFIDRTQVRKRSLIETVNDELKNIAQIEHTHHRSIGGFAANLMSAMAAYSFLPKKPSLNIEIIEREILLSGKSLDAANLSF